MRTTPLLSRALRTVDPKLARSWMTAAWVIAFLQPPGVEAGDCLTLQNIGPNIDVSTAVTTERADPAVAFNGAANEYLVVWSDQRNPGNLDIFGQVVGADGAPVGVNQPIIEFASAQIDPDVVYNSNAGEYFVAWRTQQAGFFNDSRGRRVGTNGVPVAPDFFIGEGFEVSMVHNGTTGQILHTSRGFGIFGQRLSIAGPVGPLITIAPGPAGAPAPNGQVAWDNVNNLFFATWRDQVSEDLRGYVIADDGGLVTGPIVLSTSFPNSGRLAAGAAFNALDQRYLVTYGLFQDDDLFGVFVDWNGNLPDVPFPIAENIPAPATPHCAFSPAANTFVVVWQNGGDIVARAVAADGTVGTDILTVASGTGAGAPRVAYNRTADEFLCVWRDDRNLGAGSRDIFVQRIACGTTTSVTQSSGSSPTPLQWSAAPNPFAHATRLTYTLAAPEQVRVGIYSSAGRMIRVLADRRHDAGTHSVTWDGVGPNGAPQPAGVYFARIVRGSSAVGGEQVRRIVLLR